MNIKKFQFKKVFFICLIFAFILSSFGFGLYIGYSKKLLAPKTEDIKKEGEVLNQDKIPEYLSKDVDFNLFWDAWKLIKNNYVKQPVSETKLFYGAMKGLLSGLDDPYSVFMEPAVSKKFSQEIKGNFEGIGAEIAIKDERLTIVAPLSGSPAEKAGLKAGDKVLLIDNLDTTDITLENAVNLIRGEKDTEVSLTVSRKGLSEPKKITIVRNTINIPSVQWRQLEKNPDISYIKVIQLNEDTADTFKKAVDESLVEKPKGLILDLRNDPGGLLDVAIALASYWVEKGSIVIEQFGPNYENSFTQDRKIEYETRAYNKLKDIPTVVLVNGGSASGSEIIAGALQDYGKATLVGEKTFGKGSVQELQQLSDGSSIKLTIAEWFTPKGRIINKQGIEPDIKIEMTEKDYEDGKDPQMDKAIEILNAK